ncbi:MAG: 2-oxoglutarate dehydrogenase complex dihydrolipoyllysine-residue succinyltransferase [Planctomycetota bacterium]|nr:MAG: 2-oxoglutarate dehydrogenase complex dihydrolipoyllysine-residue succinyltransferase [Planctomycetota bacterium]
MTVELKVPAVGESITEVQIGKWLVDEGDHVEKDDNLVEVESDKATLEIPAPASGTVAKILKQSGDTVAVGDVIGHIEPGEGGAAPARKQQAKEQAATEDDQPQEEPEEEPAGESEDEEAAAAAHAQAAESIRQPQAKPPRRGRTPAPRIIQPRGRKSEPRREKDDHEKSPAADRIGLHLSEELEEDDGSGNEEGLLISTDVPRPVASNGQRPRQRPREGREEEIVPMSPIRRRIAQRLVEAQQTAALLTTFNEIDMSAVIELRNEHKKLFQERYGIKLGFMSFFVKAVIDALKHVPQVNAEVRESDIAYFNYFDIGIAVGGGKGLVVPVLRDADRMSFAEIELTIADLAERARNNQLELAELQGGTFTISNGGIYGSMLSTPIVNPPQSGILGLHAIQDRPVAREGQVVIRPMMYVALTYDHRIVDGQGAVTFLKRIKEVVEEPMRMLVEI